MALINRIKTQSRPKVNNPQTSVERQLKEKEDDFMALFKRVNKLENLVEILEARIIALEEQV